MAAEPALAADEIAVWWMPTAAVLPAHLQRWLGLFDDQERDRAARFFLDADRRDFIAAHALLRSMLAFYGTFPAARWRFIADPDGKPRIDLRAGGAALEFNLSHTRGLVAGAVAAAGLRVGIDVEEIEPREADFRVAEEFFAPAEVRALKAMPPAEQATGFFRYWTLKEAYIKAVGSGLAMPLQSFGFTLAPPRITFEAGSGDDAAAWEFAVLPTTDRHILSVAAARSGVHVTPRALIPEHL
jgi:4'-phosphopantetheinyl transferase